MDTQDWLSRPPSPPRSVTHLWAAAAPNRALPTHPGGSGTSSAHRRPRSSRHGAQRRPRPVRHAGPASLRQCPSPTPRPHSRGRPVLLFALAHSSRVRLVRNSTFCMFFSLKIIGKNWTPGMMREICDLYGCFSRAKGKSWEIACGESAPEGGRLDFRPVPPLTPHGPRLPRSG